MKTILVTAIVLMSVFFVGCGGGDNTTAIESDSVNIAKIVTREDASKAIGAVQSMRLDVLASAMSQSLMTQLGAKAAPNRITYPVPYSKQRECSVSGTVNTSGEKSNAFTYHATNVFDNCTHINNIVVNGTQTVDATLENNRLLASLSDNDIDIAMGKFMMNLTARIKLYTNLDFSVVEIILLQGGEGEISKDDNDNIVPVMFSDFNVTIDTKNANMHLNGRAEFFVESIVYDIQTIVPVTIGSNEAFTSGELNIDGALFKFNNNSTVTVTLTNGDIYTMAQGRDVLYELNPDELQFIRDDAKEVVIDKRLQLVWQDDIAAKTVKKPLLTKENFDAQDWFNTSGDTAATYCSELTLGGYDDWRMPTSSELWSLRYARYLYLFHYIFHNTAGDFYWTSQNGERIEEIIDFFDDNIMSEDVTKDNSYNIRCVREEINFLTRQQPLEPPTCKGYVLESGSDTNNNAVLDNDEVIFKSLYYENGTPITLNELKEKIARDEDVTSVNTCKITDMSGLLSGNTSFNQDISSWNVAAVINMSDMFYSAEAFNQPLNDWNVSNVTNMSGMFVGSSLSTANYDALLKGWSSQTLQHNVNFSAGETKYSPTSQAARDILTGTYNWTIEDGGGL